MNEKEFRLIRVSGFSWLGSKKLPLTEEQKLQNKENESFVRNSIKEIKAKNE